MQARPRKEPPLKGAQSSSKSWRKYRLDYGLIVGSGLIVVIASEILGSNIRACSSFGRAISGSVDEFMLGLIIFAYFILPLLAICIGAGGILGFAVKLSKAKMFMLVAILAVLGGTYLSASASKPICGGGPWP
jgi:hypothetical protein